MSSYWCSYFKWQRNRQSKTALCTCFAVFLLDINYTTDTPFRTSTKSNNSITIILQIKLQRIHIWEQICVLKLTKGEGNRRHLGDGNSWNQPFWLGELNMRLIFECESNWQGKKTANVKLQLGTYKVLSILFHDILFNTMSFSFELNIIKLQTLYVYFIT